MASIACSSSEGDLQRPLRDRQRVRPDLFLAQEKAPSGFEPLYGEKEDGEPHRREPATAGASELPEELQRIVERIAQREREGKTSGRR